MRNRRQRLGFTLVELMIVVAIMGLLVAVAMPAFMKYMRRAKTTEAVDKLAYLYRMSSTYATGERVSRGLAAVIPQVQFPATSTLTPSAVPAAVRVLDPAGTWTTGANGATWQALSFAMSNPHYFSYYYTSSGVGTAAAFTAGANGDLDGNFVLSTFERAGGMTSTREVTGSPGLYMAHELE